MANSLYRQVHTGCPKIILSSLVIRHLQGVNIIKLLLFLIDYKGFCFEYKSFAAPFDNPPSGLVEMLIRILKRIF